MKKQNIVWLGLFFIAVVALFLRFYRFSDFVMFLGDQGRDALIFRNIVTLKHWPAIGAPSSVGMVFLGPFYYYLIAPFILLFRFSPVGPAFGVAVLSIFGMILTYHIVLKTVRIQIALITLIFMTFSLELVRFARFSWNPNLLPYFMFLTLFFFYEWMRTKKIMFAVLFGAFLSFSMQLHYLALLAVVPITGYFLYKTQVFRDIKNYVTGIGASVLTFGLFSSPLIIFDLRHEFINSKKLLELFGSGQLGSDSSYLNRLMDTTKNLFLHGFQLEVSPVVSLLIFVILISGGMYFAKKKSSGFVALQSFFMLFYILGFAYLPNARHAHYFGPVFISFYVLLSIFPYCFKKSFIRNGLILLIFFLYLLTNIPKFQYFFIESGNQILYAQKVADSFKPHIGEQPIQIAALPFTETDGHFRYFLDVAQYNVLPHDSQIQPKELFVMCFQEDCHPDSDPQWQIAAFSDKKVVDSWSVENVKIYKIIHGPKK